MKKPKTKVAYARLDADGTAIPKTRIVSHPKRDWCVGPGSPLVNPEYVGDRGSRIPLFSTKKGT